MFFGVTEKCAAYVCIRPHTSVGSKMLGMSTHRHGVMLVASLAEQVGERLFGLLQAERCTEAQVRSLLRDMRAAVFESAATPASNPDVDGGPFAQEPPAELEPPLAETGDGVQRSFKTLEPVLCTLQTRCSDFTVVAAAAGQVAAALQLCESKRLGLPGMAQDCLMRIEQTAFGKVKPPLGSHQ
jgi:hypothetical protein